MSNDDRKMRQTENAVPVQESRGRSPDLTRRRLVVKAAVSAVPVVMTLRSGAALASAGNCEAIQLFPKANLDGAENIESWSFVTNPNDVVPTTMTPYMVGDKVQCVTVDSNNCPIGTSSPAFNEYQNVADFKCQTGIIVQASSGGSFTHQV